MLSAAPHQIGKRNSFAINLLNPKTVLVGRLVGRNHSTVIEDSTWQGDLDRARDGH